MARFRVTLKSRGMLDLLKSRAVEKDMEARADRVAAQARSQAPVLTGAYRDSIEAESQEHRTRVVGRVVATVDYAQSVEARHRVLGRAIDAARG